ncbi:MAG: uroporphyrinogen-III C-methyltransferase [Burkholderiales bacterium]
MTDPTKNDQDDPAPQQSASEGASGANTDAQSGESVSEAGSVAPRATRGPRRAGTALLWLVVLIVFCLLGFEWYDTRARLAQLRDDVAARASELGVDVRRSLDATRELRESNRELAGKIGAIESRQNENRSREVALEALYQELSRGRDEWTLSEVEQTLQIAAQQLHLAGNVSSALAALQEIDARLARADRVELGALRKLIQRDIERLKSAPNLDVAGLTLRLDSVIESVDTLPLRSEEKKTENVSSAAPPSGRWWERAAASAWGELKSLVRIQRVDVNDPRLLAPDQAYFLRENLKLRLLHARVALLQRNEPLFRSDIKQAREWIERYFDPRAKTVTGAAEALAQLDAASVQVELPSLSESLNMARRLRQPRESN